MLANDETTLRSFCARILGWTTDREVVVEHAVRSIELAIDQSAALVVLGEFDLVPIAQALHRRMFGAERPFVVCDRRRENTSASVRSAMNQGSGVAALEAARGGSLCVRFQRLPTDFPSVVAQVRSTEDARLILVGDGRYDTHPFLVLPAPIRIPSLRVRTKELVRIVDEYAGDAIAELSAAEIGGRKASFTEADRQWVIEHCPLTLPEIEKATLRLVALRMSRSLPHAAERLGMAPVSLARWIGAPEAAADRFSGGVTRAAR
jgi:hypothetical protein